MEIARPLVFLDVETTGVNVNKDRIIQFAAKKIYSIGTTSNDELNFLINPTIPIPDEATKVHGITNAMVFDKPVFKDIAHGILNFIDQCDIAGYNCRNFDLPLLLTEFKSAGFDWNYQSHKIIDIMNIFKIKEQRNLKGAVKFYCNKVIENAHDALGDVISTIEVFESQLKKYSDLPKTVEDLDYFSNYESIAIDLSGKFKFNIDGKIVFAFGDYKDQIVNPKLKDHKTYLEWMLRKDFPYDTKEIIKELMQEQSVS